MSKCKTCGKNCDGEYCFQHKPRKPLKASKGLPTYINKATNRLYEGAIQDPTVMQKFFLKIWNKRLHYSEVSMDHLGREPLSVFFHHILPKEKYPQAALDEENIILLTFEEHNQVESDMYRYDEVNKRRERLKLKYERTEQGEEAGD